MSRTPPANDDSWYVEANCPKYFDFATALQAPCSLDREYNPPLHDFVYQSDDESDNFFRNAAETPKSPLPKRPQQRMLSPRHFGNPTNKHKPKASFEDFLRQHDLRQRRKNRRSVHLMGSVPTAAADEAKENTKTASPAQQFDHRSRYRSLPARRNGESAHQQTIQQDKDADEDLTMDLTTPTLDSILTPVTMRRTARQYTPSRVRIPSNIARSLFASPGTPLASPLRRMRRRNQGSRPGPISGEPLRSSPDEQSQGDVTSIPLRAVTGAHRRPHSLRLPLRTTPPSSGETIPSAGNPASRAANKSRPYIDRSAQPPGEARLGLPLRAPRPSTSVGSTSTVTPPLPEHPQSRPGSGSTSTRDMPTDRQWRELQNDSRTDEPRAELMSRSQRNQISKSLRDFPQDSLTQSASDSEEIDDPDLRHKVEEHNKRVEADGQQPQLDFGASSRGPDSRSQRLLQPLRLGRQASYNDAAPTQSQNQEQADPLERQVGPQRGKQDHQSTSLNDLLQSENDRVLQERKQRLPERRKALQFNKESVLKRLEGQRQVSANQRKRTSARVEFTSSMVGQKAKPKPEKAQQKQPSASIRFKSSKPRNPTVPPRANTAPQKRMQGFKSRTKSAGATLPGGDQNRNPNAPLSGKTVKSRSMINKISRTDQIKAAAKQKMEENRMENDLKSMLNQHNHRVENNRRDIT